MKVIVGVDVIVGVVVWVGVNDEVGVIEGSGVDSTFMEASIVAGTGLLVEVLNVLAVGLEDHAGKKNSLENGWMVNKSTPARMIMLNSIMYPGIDRGRNPKVKKMIVPMMAVVNK